MNVRPLLSSLKLAGQCRHVCKCQTNSPNVQLLNEYTLNYFFFEITSLIWKRLHCRWTAAKFTITIGAYVLWNRRNLYCVIPAKTRGRNLHGLIRETIIMSNCHALRISSKKMHISVINTFMLLTKHDVSVVYVSQYLIFNI